MSVNFTYVLDYVGREGKLIIPITASIVINIDQEQRNIILIGKSRSWKKFGKKKGIDTMMERKDDYYRFKAEVTTNVKNILSAEQFKQLSNVLDEEFKDTSIYYKKGGGK